MTEMTPGAQLRFDHYLDELRRVLMGSPSVDLADVERDVRDHIEAALSNQAKPVEEPVLERVLHDLGSPAQWLPGEARPWYRKSRAEWLDLCRQHANNANRQFFDFIKIRIANGSESYRLAYLSLAVLALGCCAFGLGRGDDAFFFFIVATLASFILSRAALSLFGADKLSSGQKWLLYPSLIVVYVPLLVVLLFGAVVVAGGVMSQIKLQNSPSRDRKQLAREVEIYERNIEMITRSLELCSPDSPESPQLRARLEKSVAARDARLQHLKQTPPLTDVSEFTLPAIACGVTAIAGVNWFLVGLLLVVFPQMVRNIFHPFADRLTRWPGYGLVAIGLLLSLGGLRFVG